MFTNRKLPMRSVRLIQEYSTPCRQSEWKSSKTISTTPVYEETTVNKLTIDTFCISILVIIINVLICVSLFYLLAVVLSSSMCN